MVTTIFFSNLSWQTKLTLLQPKIKQLEKCKHPNSRKTRALAKTLKRSINEAEYKETVKLHFYF